MWGCIAGGVIGAPVFMVLLLINTLGNYATEPRPSFVINVLLPAATLAMGVGWLTWLVVRWLLKDR